MSARPEAVRHGRRRARLGLTLVAISWTANWGLDGLRTHLLFFPLWTGWILALDGWIEQRDGSSLGSRTGREFAGLFLISVPLWWLFEAANERLGNWEYLGREHFGDVEFACLASLAFSTVVPAILEAVALAGGLAALERFTRGPRVNLQARGRIVLLLLGAASWLAVLAWPRVAYPLVWVGGVLVLDPVVTWRGGRSFSQQLARGDWRPWVACWCGGLLTGFFWELWNQFSWPRWIYHIPGIDGPRLFEMPLLGYLGYLPFAQTVYLWKELWFVEPELPRSLPSDRSPERRPDPPARARGR